MDINIPEDKNIKIEEIVKPWISKAFATAGIVYVADLLSHTKDELYRIEGVGGKAIEQLEAALAEQGLLEVVHEAWEEEERYWSSVDFDELLKPDAGFEGKADIDALIRAYEQAHSEE